MAYLKACWGRLKHTEHGVWISKKMLLRDMPAIGQHHRVVQKLEKSLIEKGLLKRRQVGSQMYYELTEKAADWGQTNTNEETQKVREIYPEITLSYKGSLVKYESRKGGELIVKKSDPGDPKRSTQNNGGEQNMPPPKRVDQNVPPGVDQNVPPEDESGGPKRSLRGGPKRSTKQLQEAVTSISNSNQLAVCADLKNKVAPDREIQAEKSPKSKKKITAKKAKPPTRKTWEAYAWAFENVYGKPPVRPNAKQNGQLAQFVKYCGQDDAPRIAAWYVMNSTDRQVLADSHPIGRMLAMVEALRNQCAMDWRPTQQEVAQMQRRQNVEASAEEAKKILDPEYKPKSGESPKTLTVEESLF